MALDKVEALEATIGGNRVFCSGHGIGYHCAQSLVKAADASCRILKALCMLYGDTVQNYTLSLGRIVNYSYNNYVNSIRELVN